MSFSVFVSTTWRGLARAERSGGSWTVTRHLDDEETRALASSRAGGVVLLGTQGNGVWRSEDSGATWSRSGLDGMIVKSLAISPADDRVVYAGTKPPMMFKSEDGGRTWSELVNFRHVRRWWWRQPAERPTTPYVSSLAASPLDPDIVVVGIEAGAVLRTEDGGASWRGHLSGAVRDCHVLAFHDREPYVYEGGGALRKPGASISRDSGSTWERVERGPDHNYGWAVVGDPEEPETWFASLASSPRTAHADGNAEAYIYRCDPRGWKRLAGGLPQPMTSMVYALISAAPNHVFAGAANGRVWHTQDRGETWTEMPFDLGSIHRELTAL